ncbi:hypothetical protein F9C11_20940 [Amycolatopsis sp. VS8301801F10]|uniref:hypothetical protein n=1 Tax=Amycolatopsis sp. VS8301801F10 TaxID=2652442 RepID=UPI0038FCB137
MGWWPTVVKSRAEPWVFLELEAAHALPELPRGPVVVDEHYLHIRLQAMRLPFQRRWTSTYHASLNSYVRLEHGGPPPGEFLLTTSPAQLRSIGAGDRRRIAMGPTRLAGPVPYPGGGLELEIGLFAVKDRDLAGPYLDFLQSLGETAGVSYVGAAVHLIRPLQQGLAGLLGLADTTLEAGAARTIDPVRTGVFAVLAITRDQLGERRPRLVDDTLCWSDSTPVDDIAYVIFSIETSIHRTDWRTVPGLAEAYTDLAAAVRDDRYPDVAERLSRLRRTAVLSPDLTSPDADTIIAHVTAMIDRSFAASGQSTVPRQIPPLAELELFPAAPDEPANHDIRTPRLQRSSPAEQRV